MAIAAFLFARLDSPDSSVGESEPRVPASARLRRAAAWDSDAHDHDLATRIKDESTDNARLAFDALYAAYVVPLWRLARQFTQSDDAAQDIVQDVFVALWVRRETWDVSGSVRAYLYGAVRNRALNTLRDGARHSNTLPEILSAATDPRPDSDAEMHELERALRQAVDVLPERQRTALLLFWYESMNMSEIARVLKITPAASRKLLLAAQTTLRRAVAKHL